MTCRTLLNLIAITATQVFMPRCRMGSNLALNPDAPSAGARSDILARPPYRRAG